METKIIDELLEDKQQIVTYKYLMSKLDIHPNKAKQLLKDYVSKLDEDKKYSTTFVIGGTLKENDEFCIVLAYDDHVETMRRRFKQVDFEHLYSIQPINRFDDINNALYLADSTLNHGSLSSSINRKEKNSISVHNQCAETKMDVDLPSTNKETNSTSNKVLNNHSKDTKVEVNTKLDKTQKKAGVDFFAKTTKTNGTKPEVTERKASPKKNNSDFFSKFKKSSSSPNTPTTNSKNEGQVENGIKDDKKTESPKKRVSESVPNELSSPKKNNSDFFAKPKKSGGNSQVSKADSKSEVLLENVIKNEKKVDKEPPKKKALENVPSEEKTAKKSNKKKDSEKKSKKKNSSQKVKRKRIQTFDDSSDEEVDSEEEDKKRSDQAMEVEEEIDFVQPTPPRPTPRENRKKEKQTTTSTFIDDDGFVCTTKEVQIVETDFEPPSESVENVEPPKELNTEPVLKKVKSSPPVQVDKKKGKTKPSKNSPSSQGGMKQSSLTSFFKTK